MNQTTRITIFEESLCGNPRCTGGRIGRFPEAEIWHTGPPDRPGDVCPDCGGSGIVRKQISHNEYMHRIEREREERDIDAGGLFGAAWKWLKGGKRPDAGMEKSGCSLLEQLIADESEVPR